ncbi:hypothetical protein MRB53_020658 [Persea americana]|uniref:Uncharacterized protein n=1 Tax=Persea americana TaxID=3435 RepID=A0ACC2L2F9_PERAE|nr:hypothetical protein MRB53_020658 [Persea americana]
MKFFFTLASNWLASSIQKSLYPSCKSSSCIQTSHSIGPKIQKHPNPRLGFCDFLRKSKQHVAPACLCLTFDFGNSSTF